MLTLVFVPMLAKLSPEIDTPMTLPVALAEAKVDTPLERNLEPGKSCSNVPLCRCWKNPLAFQSTEISPVGPANVKKSGLPVVLVLRRSVLPPPLRSVFGISPEPPKKVQLKNTSHCPTK